MEKIKVKLNEDMWVGGEMKKKGDVVEIDKSLAKEYLNGKRVSEVKEK